MAVKRGPIRQDATTIAACTTASRITSKVCPHCKEASPQVYEAGWACLVPECSQGFWKFPAKALSRPNAFEVVQGFLQASTAAESKASMLPFPLQPQEEDSSDVAVTSQGMSGSSEEGLKGERACHLKQHRDPANQLTPSSSPHRPLLQTMPPPLLSRIPRLPPLRSLRYDDPAAATGR